MLAAAGIVDDAQPAKCDLDALPLEHGIWRETARVLNGQCIGSIWRRGRKVAKSVGRVFLGTRLEQSTEQAFHLAAIGFGRGLGGGFF